MFLPFDQMFGLREGNSWWEFTCWVGVGVRRGGDD